MRGLAAWCVVLSWPVAGCAVPESHPDGRVAAASARVAVRIEFEPALLAPGLLRYAHECGEQGEVTTACTSVELSLPTGPVVFVLRTGEGLRELAWRVVPGMEVIRW